MGGITRRGLLGGAAAFGVASAVPARPVAAAAAVPFHGVHQAGISTSPPARLSFAAFDVLTDRRAELRELLRTWSAGAARMTAGLPPWPGHRPADRPPLDSGEALGLPVGGLTLTFGLGPGIFDRRFGLAAARPPGLRSLPSLPGDRLVPAYCGGDLMVQACAEEAVVAHHAIRQLARAGQGVVRLRWLQLGFGATARTRRTEQTPRNLFGMKDGTANPTVEDPDFDRVVWVPPGGAPAWLAGGSYLAVRKIRMHLERWDGSALGEQERVIGRRRTSGAPLSGGAEFTPPVLAALPPHSHVRLAHPDLNGGARILRRGYNYDDGCGPDGRLDAGLFFLGYVADLDRQLVPVLRRLAARDALNEYVTHVASAVFAVPPGATPGGYVGETLLG